MLTDASSSIATRTRRWALHAVVLASLTACADYSGIAPHAQALDAAALGLNGSSASVNTIDAQWWRVFGDAQLNALVDQALANSPSLRVAQARIARAQAAGDAVRGDNLPHVDGSADLTRQLLSENSIYPPPLGGSVVNMGDVRATVNWELDFFGKNRAALDAALGQVQAAEADARAARMLLSSTVVRGYIGLQRIEAQLAVAERTLEQRVQSKDLVRQRVSAGLDTQLELQQSDGALPEARLQIEMLHEQKALGLNALAALLAQPNKSLELTFSTQLPTAPVVIAESIPLDLLGRRADVDAARWRVEAALRDVHVAKTMFYPNINLTAFAGFSSIGFDQLTQDGSRQWGVGPAIRLPIFEAGRLRANLSGKTAEVDAAVESYNTQVIDAVRDVADQLTSARAIARQQTEQAAAQTSAETAYSIATQRYQAGLGTYLNVLSAETAVLAQRRLSVDLAARALDTQVQLIRALGGGQQTDAEIAANASLASQISRAQP